MALAVECFVAPQLHKTPRALCFHSRMPHFRISCKKRPVVLAMAFGASQPGDPFVETLAAAARTPLGEAQLQESRDEKRDEASPPLLDIVSNMVTPGSVRNFSDPVLMAAPAHVETSYNEHRPRKPPPDLPSLLLNSRIVYVGMPLVPAVTELVIAELLYLQYSDPTLPIYMYINSTGTSRADGETVGMETEGFAIHDTMQLVKNEIHTVGVGAAIGQACLLLAAGTKGKRYMLPHATAMIQQPRMPSMGQMPAIDLHLRAKEVIHNRDTLVELLAEHTGNPVEKVAKVMRRPYYMSPKKAMDFGVVDKILWRGQEAMGETLSPEQWDKRAGIRAVERPMTYGAGTSGLG
ncbi:ATP-dependent Clp protease proteolytic subunit-related protein 3, chloroplastic [Selaginella moellendorffii]|nr:ATP-dependent Clp protease proteolytic subunit-related protein 3, chloroplastic [Selaginella moellendorffii]XP_002990376.2 ATP-dependent Clp protease proteolytic subunit-related protein 3, chloroplastic [Selaginella moellendorffii]XP_002994294.2 ATP-dependent Clp protease proteolytic subunit-related protein 3, chloroplastic [Selaginella moellendorffii]|eukprot:XP_002979404.2 ATP-dependent Clp protease proteolytic subunit-related protein 3, chloroplastic [Selaginella moellendorffii]